MLMSSAQKNCRTGRLETKEDGLDQLPGNRIYVQQNTDVLDLGLDKRGKKMELGFKDFRPFQGFNYQV